MVQKYINEDKIDAEQEIQLYLMILDMQVINTFNYNYIRLPYVRVK